MPRQYKPQYLQVAERLAERIQYGDYLVTDIPSTRRLADEFKVSHIVARKAVGRLLADGLCRSLPNGRIIAAARNDSQERTLALLTPAFACGYFQRCRIQLEQAAQRENWLFRQVFYVHWHDPIIQETLQNFDAVFLLGNSEELDAETLGKLSAAAEKLATIDLDLQDVGICRLAFFDVERLKPLLTHLGSLGAQRIDCVNTQPLDREMQRRIELWKRQGKVQGYTGTLHNQPVPHYQDPMPAAYEIIQAYFQAGNRPDAFFCTTEAAALGVMRAIIDAGLRPGRDIALCTPGDGGCCRYYSPTITSLEMGDLSGEFVQVLSGMEKHQHSSNQLINPPNKDIYLGESTLWWHK